MRHKPAVVIAVVFWAMLNPRAQADGVEQVHPFFDSPAPEFSAPSVEPQSLGNEAPAPERGEITPDISTGVTRDAPLSPAGIWERIRSGYAMRELDSPLVREKEAWYAARPDYVKRMVERARRYLFHIAEEVEKRGMPTEIALLPMIESAYHPRAYSRSHASGIWQFIPSTGKNYGLHQNWWYDGRRDIVSGTNAALNYLQTLHGMFGDWELALAAYNWGEGAVSRAVLKNRAKGLPTDYQSLTLPPETRNYLPKLMAVKNIVSNPAAFGLELDAIPNRPYFQTVSTSRHMDVTLAAQMAEISVEEFIALNPAHSRPVVTTDKSNTLLLPVDKVETFKANLEAHDKPWVSWRTYQVKQGDRLDKIAPKFGLSESLLKRINGIFGRKKVSPGQTLLVPVDGKAVSRDSIELASLQAVQAPAEARSFTHTVRKGETFASIARRYSVSANQIKIWNGGRNVIKAGQKLVIRDAFLPARKAVRKPVRGGKRAQYAARRGDTSIARR